jgi:hypothetical protein
MGLTAHMAYKGQIRTAYRTLIENLRRNYHMEHTDADGNLILKRK